MAFKDVKTGRFAKSGQYIGLPEMERDAKGRFLKPDPVPEFLRSRPVIESATDDRPMGALFVVALLVAAVIAIGAACLLLPAR